MATLTTDRFVEAFAARLIEEGQRVLRLNDPQVRERLYQVYEFLDQESEAEENASDQRPAIQDAYI